MTNETHGTPRTALLLTAVGLLVAGLAAPPAVAAANVAHPRHRVAERVDTPLGYVRGTHKPQTSDGVVGRIAPRIPARLRAEQDTSIRSRWTVAPGIHGVVYDQTDARGANRFYLLSVKFQHPGVSIDTMNNGPVRDVGTVPSMTKHAGAVAGVNGDFYDIGDTGAPLGIDVNSRRGLLNGRTQGWNSAFYFDSSGRPEIGRLEVHTVIKQHPRIKITNLNGPSVRTDGIGLYNSRFGVSSTRVTDGVTHNVRTVTVRNGKVVSSRSGLPSPSRIHGQLLIGRGIGAAVLAKLNVGEPITLHSSITGPQLSGSPRMALTGNQFLVDNGLIRVTDDREMAPRTAIGIDRDTHEILILVVDGRQRFSRGYTMVELADQMMDLGADEALNLDGGGSSTFVAKRGGSLKVINSPSDGFLRQVANGVAVSYHQPKKKQHQKHQKQHQRRVPSRATPHHAGHR